MQITISGRQVEISDSFRNKVETDLAGMAERHQLNPVDMNVTLSKQGHLFHIDVNSHIGKGVTLRARGEGNDAYACFADTLETLSKRLRKYKRRLTDHHKHHDQHGEKEHAPYYVINSPEEENNSNEDLAPAIIAEMPKEIPSLSVADAVMRMDLSTENTLVFRHSTSGRLNIIYRRMDGNIGWVDPR